MFPLTYEGLKEYASLAYKRVEDKELSFELYDMGILSHSTGPTTNSHSTTAKFSRIVNKISPGYTKSYDDSNEVDLVVFLKNMTDRASKVTSGSAFHTNSRYITAAVNLANEDLVHFKKTKKWPPYLNNFVILSTLEWQSKRDIIIQLYKQVATECIGNDIFESTASTQEALKEKLRACDGKAFSLPYGLTISSKEALPQVSVTSHTPDPPTEWTSLTNFRVKARNTDGFEETSILDVTETMKRVRAGEDIQIEAQEPFGERVKHSAYEWFTLKAVKLVTSEKTILNLIDRFKNTSAAYSKHFLISAYDLDEENYSLDD